MDIEKLDVYGSFERKLSTYGLSLRIKDYQGKFYKLRVFPSTKMAEKQESIVQLVSKIFPKFYGRDRNYLLFEFLDARTISKDENPDIFLRIGEMCGEVNNIKADGNAKKDLEEHYYTVIESFLKKGIISSEDLRRILMVYKKLLCEIQYKVVLSIMDIQFANFMLDSQNKLYFVDEDGIDYNIQGYGFDTFSDKFDKKQIKYFFKGYNSVNSIKFYDKDYEKLVIFLHLVEKIQWHSNVCIGYKYTLRHLLQFCRHKD